MPQNLIPINEYCLYYKIEPSFVEILEDTGIIELASDGELKYIQEEQLGELERYRLLHFELNINIEGIDAIRHLLQKQEKLLREIDTLRSMLRIYE